MKPHFLLAATLALATPAAATTVTLDFDGDICTNLASGACFNGASIDQDYGDIAGQVDVIYDADRGTAALQPLFYWSAGYEDLTGIAYGVNGGGGLSITLDAMAGYEISLQSFDIAPYLNRSRNTLVQVIDIEDGGVVFNQDYTPLSTSGATSLTFSGLQFTSAFGLQINLGPDAWDVGIDNIVFSVTEIDDTPGTPDPSVIPLPASAVLLLGALGGLSVLRRRNTQA
jgi:hypothetical protein